MEVATTAANGNSSHGPKMQLEQLIQRLDGPAGKDISVLADLEVRLLLEIIGSSLR